ncbi:unnamed protein product [Chrysoparadoxa australica]
MIRCQHLWCIVLYVGSCLQQAAAWGSLQAPNLAASRVTSGKLLPQAHFEFDVETLRQKVVLEPWSDELDDMNRDRDLRTISMLLPEKVAKRPSTLARVKAVVRLFRKVLGIEGDKMRRVILREPSLLHFSAENNLHPTMMFFLSEMGVPKESLSRMVLRQPSVLCLSLENNLKPTTQYFTEKLEIYREDLISMIARQPSILAFNVQSKMEPMTSYLKQPLEQGGLGLSHAQMISVLVREPSILTLSLENNIKVKIRTFKEEIRATPEQIQMAIIKSPNLLVCSLENRIKPRIACMRVCGVMPRSAARTLRLVKYSEGKFAEWVERRSRSVFFMEHLGFSRDELRVMKRKSPALAGAAVESTMADVVMFLRFEIGMCSDELHKTLYKYPQVLSCYVEGNLRETAAFIQDGLCLSRDQLKLILVRQPSLLGMSLANNLQPKAEYLIDKLQASANELGEALVSNPTLLEYSFNKRIRPRVEKMEQLGLNLSMRSIRQICKYPDAAFEKWLLSTHWPRHTTNPPCIPKAKAKGRRARAHRD